MSARLAYNWCQYPGHTHRPKHAATHTGLMPLRGGRWRRVPLCTPATLQGAVAWWREVRSLAPGA